MQLVYLDDLYVITSLRKARAGFHLLASRVCNAGNGAPPPAAHGATAGRPASAGSSRWAYPLVTRTSSTNGGANAHRMSTPSWTTCRPDLQCAWLLLLLCGSTRANHVQRNMPRRTASTWGGARPRNLRDLVGLPGGGGRRQRPARFPAWAGRLRVRHGELGRIALGT